MSTSRAATHRATRRYGDLLTSADSLAWSYAARRDAVALPGCTGHRNCANCSRYALRWRTQLLTALDHRPRTLWDAS